LEKKELIKDPLPSFSVVISTYNRLRFLKRAIESVQNQTIPCELIVVDDASTDGTENYVKSLGHNIIYHRNKVNSGQSKAVNTGVNLASNGWIKFLDDDDYLAPDCLEVMAKSISLHPEAVICTSLCFEADEKGIILRKSRKTGPGQVFYIPKKYIHFGMLLELADFGTPVQVACKKDAFLRSGGWNEIVPHYGNDVASWLRISEFGDAIFINKHLSFRTVWQQSYYYHISPWKQLDCIFYLKRKMYDRIDRRHITKVPSLERVLSACKLNLALIQFFKRKRILTAIRMSFPEVLSLFVWINWIKMIMRILTRNSNKKFFPYRHVLM
jgi:glycosyltransferase involved in cell wall biosynthesis